MAERNEASGPTVLIGVLAPMSGGSAYLGKVITNGIQLALNRASAEGRGPEIRVLGPHDDRSDPEAAGQHVQDFAERGAVAVLGPVDSHCTATAAQRAGELRLPLVTPAATASSLITVDGDGRVRNEWFFRAISSDRSRVEEMADWMASKYPNGIILLHETPSTPVRPCPFPMYGEQMAFDAKRKLDDVRRPSVLVGYPQDVSSYDLHDFIDKNLSPRKPHAIAILGRSRDALLLTRALRRTWRKMPIFVISPGKAMFSQFYGDTPIYAVLDTVIQNVNMRALRQFRTEYMQTFPGSSQDEAVDQYATFGFDAANILIDAIRRASKKHSGAVDAASLPTFRDALRVELEHTPIDREGVITSGPFVNHELRTVAQCQKMVRGVWQDVTDADLFEVADKSPVRSEPLLERTWLDLSETMDQVLRKIAESWIYKTIALIILASALFNLVRVLAPAPRQAERSVTPAAADRTGSVAPGAAGPVATPRPDGGAGMGGH